MFFEKSKDKDNTIQELPTIQLQGEYLKCDSDIWGMKIDFIDENQFLIEELSQNKLYAIYELDGNSLRKKVLFNQRQWSMGGCQSFLSGYGQFIVYR